MARSTVKSAPVPAADVQPPVENKPVHVIHYGSVRGLIHRSESKRGMAHTVICERVQLDRNRQEQVSQTFESGDLRMLAKVAGECLRWIDWQERLHVSGGPPTAETIATESAG